MEKPKIEILLVTDKEEMISYWPLIKDTDLCDVDDYTLVLQNCLVGSFKMLKGIVGGKLAGICVYNPLADGTCFVLILHLKNHVTLFRDTFFELCRKTGFRRILASTKIPEEIYTRLTGLKKVYSIYEYDLTENTKDGT